MRCIPGYYMCIKEGQEFEACHCEDDMPGNSTQLGNPVAEDRYEEVEDIGRT